MKRIELIKELALPEITSSRIRLRKRVLIEKSEVKQFVVQLEIEKKGKFKPIIRMDAYHGFVHKDEFFMNRPKKKTKINISSLKEAVNYAEKDILENLEKYVRRFEWKKRETK